MNSERHLPIALVPIQFFATKQDGGAPPKMDPVTGKATLRIESIQRNSDGQFFDFNDNTFKAAGWTTLFALLAEIDAVKRPGWYHYIPAGVRGWDLTNITNPVAAGDTYTVTFGPETDADVALFGAVEIVAEGWHRDTALAALYDGAVNAASYGVAGDTLFTDGTLANPSDVIADIRTLADLLGTRKIRTLDDISLVLTVANWDGYEFTAKGSRFGIITVTAGTGFDGAGFMGLSATGVFPAGADFVSFENSALAGMTLPFGCSANNSGLAGTIVWTGGIAIFRDCLDTSAAVGGAPFVFDMDGLATPVAKVEFRRFAGRIQIDNMTDGGEIDLNLNGGTVTVDASCTNGSIKVSGEGRVINNSALVIDVSELLDSQAIRITKGMVLGNYLLDGGVGQADVIRNGAGFPTTQRIRVWDRAADVPAVGGGADNETNAVAATTIVGTPDGSFPTLHALVRALLTEQ